MEDNAARQNAALDVAVEAMRAEARAFAVQIRALVELADLARAEEQRAGVRQFPTLELAGSAHLGAATSSSRLAQAERVVQTLPLTLGLLDTGALLVHQARVLIFETAHCTAQLARLAEAAVLPDGAGLCPADLRERLRKAVQRLESELDSQAAEQRLADARAERRTWTSPERDGMGVAAALLSAEQLRRWQLDLDQLERAERLADRDAGVERTSDQRRADLFAALPGMVLDARRLFTRRASRQAAGPSAPMAPPEGQDGEGATSTADEAAASAAAGGGLGWWAELPEQMRPGSSTAPPARTVLNVLVPVSTVLDISREPGSIPGVGPVSAEHVRLLRPTGLRRILIAHDTGRPLQVDDQITPAEADPAALREQVLDLLTPALVKDVAEPQHDPSARLARLVDLRDLHCSGPGCSGHGDRDHLEPYPAGPTAAWNLNLLSRRCHAAKHTNWIPVRHADGSTTWTSPLGRTYQRPAPHDPPPTIDPDLELPPLRPPPAEKAPWWADQGWTRPPESSDNPAAPEESPENDAPPF